MTTHKIELEEDVRVEAEGFDIRKGIYVLPNLFTTGVLFAGFYAIIAAFKGQFNAAAIATFIAMLADSLDGRVARLTHTTSPFGAEYDSIADMVAFGVAPAILLYSWGLHFLGKPGWLFAFCYTAATALRLARFNVQVSSDKRYFRGLPGTAAAGLMAGFIWVQNIYLIPGMFLGVVAGIISVCLALLMVSNIRYDSFKDSALKNRVSFLSIILLVLGFVCVAMNPPGVLFFIFLAYAVSGPLTILMRFLKSKKSPVLETKSKKKR